MLTSDEGLLWHSSDDEFDDIATMFDDCDGIGMKHTLGAVAVDLKKLIANLPREKINDQ
jgi:hypothetical protein